MGDFANLRQPLGDVQRAPTLGDGVLPQTAEADLIGPLARLAPELAGRGLLRVEPHLEVVGHNLVEVQFLPPGAESLKDAADLIHVPLANTRQQLRGFERLNHILVGHGHGDGLRVVLPPASVIGPHAVQAEAVFFDGLESGHDGVAFHGSEPGPVFPLLFGFLFVSVEDFIGLIFRGELSPGIFARGIVSVIELPLAVSQLSLGGFVLHACRIPSLRGPSRTVADFCGFCCGLLREYVA